MSTTPLTPEVVRKIEVGDALTDGELLGALVHYDDLAKNLLVLGPKFHLAFCECNRVAESLRGYVSHRGLAQ